MSTEQIVILIVFLLLVVLNRVFIAVYIMTRKTSKHFEHDIDQKTWERIEGWRK